jgi:FADH2 O2-dependent halogenase
MLEFDFTKKPGVCWTSPSARVGQHIKIILSDFPIEGAPVPHSFNVERDVFDAALLRHASESGATVVQGAEVLEVLFSGERAAGLKVRYAPGTVDDIRARFVVDASGRRCVLATQLGLRRKDPELSQIAVYSWFTGINPPPAGNEGMLFLHFLGLERAWAWQIPLKNGVWSVGAVTDTAHFRSERKSPNDFFYDLCSRNNALAAAIDGAVARRDLRVEADYSYTVDPIAGPGWFLLGDAARFIDPVLSTGLDIAVFGALAAFEAIDDVLEGDDEDSARATFIENVNGGLDAWRDIVVLFYRLQVLFTYFAVRPSFREDAIRILQGNLFNRPALERAREMISRMEKAYDSIMGDPDNLLRPGALTRTPQDPPAPFAVGKRVFTERT